MDITVHLATTNVEPNDGYTYETDRLISAYRAQVTAALEAAYPEAAIEVQALPRTLQTRIVVGGVALREADDMTTQVEQILSRAWDHIDWDQFVQD